MTSIALRNLWARKLRTVLTALAIVLGVMMIAGTYVFTDTIDQAFDEIFTESNKGIDAVVTSKQAVKTDDAQDPPISASLLPEVRSTEGVAAAAGGIFDPQVAIIDKDGDPIGGNGAPSFGSSAQPRRFETLDYEGRAPRTANEVAIDKTAADKAGFELGDRVTVAGKESARPYRLVGFASIGDVDSFGGASIAVFTLPQAQLITGKQGEFDQIAVAADDDTTPGQLAANLTQVLPKNVEAETGEENTQSQKDDVGEFIGFLKTALLVFAGVALFVASFLIFNTFSITVAQRTREFAMLRTLGANRRQIVRSVALEALLIGFAASVIGLLLGIAFASAISSLFKATGIDLPSAGNVIGVRTVILSLAVGTVLTVVAALVPALRATRVEPVEGLREGIVVEAPGTKRLRTAIAVALTGLGLIAMLGGVFGVIGGSGAAWVGIGAGAMFLGVALLSPRLVRPLASLVGLPLERTRGVAGRLARENSVRNPGRTAATAAALMIGLALVSFVAIFAAGIRGSIDDAIDKTLGGDLILGSTDGFSDIPLTPVKAVEGVDGVAVASPYRYTQYASPDGDGYLSLVAPATAADVLKLDWRQGSDQTLTDLGPTEAVLDEKFADKRKLEVGDAFTVTTVSGRKINYTATGTFKDNTDFIGDYAASDVNARAYGEGQTTTSIFIKLDEGADTDAVRSGIDEQLKPFPTIKVQNQQELKDSISSQLNTLLGVIYALLALAVIVSLFGIVNTLALSIYERTRELGLLRAVGMSRRQTRQIVRYEAVITALIGAVLGLVLGVVFAITISRPLADEGFTLTIPVGSLLLLMVLAAAAGVVAAIGPARRASRLDVLEALSYE
ncbi:MAG: FtsX-like permease family protein [Solirubrobacterales bacterium]|nr:FtsX-like permease family protein [Solirubrobacterales bacterium]